MAYEPPDFYEFEVSPDHYPPYHMPSPPLPAALSSERYSKGTENLQTALMTGAVLSFIVLIAKDAHRAFVTRAHWIPCDFLVLSAFSIQLLSLLNAQNEAVDTSSPTGRWVIKESQGKNVGTTNPLWKDFLTIHNNRTILCVFAAYVMPAMADRGLEHSWVRWVALVITVFHHVSSEFYIVEANNAFPNVLRLWPQEHDKSDHRYYVYATIISLCFILLILLLACATIAGRSIERIVAKKISLVLRGQGEFYDGLAEQHRRHCHNCWRTVEDSVLKAWIIVRAYSTQTVIARSALTATAAIIVTIQIAITIVGGLAKVVNRQDVKEDISFKSVATILQSVFILLAWLLINVRWGTAAAYHTKSQKESQKDSWRGDLRMEDYWTRHLRELQEAGESRPRQAQSVDNKIEQLVSKETKTAIVPSILLYAAFGMQWFLVSFSKVCWLVSLMIFHNKLMDKLYNFMFEKHVMYVFEDFQKYKKILKDVEMLGESPESLWVANRKAIVKAKHLTIQGNQDGDCNCEELVDFVSNKKTDNSLGLSCLYPHKPQTGLKFLCQKRPIHGRQMEKQPSRGTEKGSLDVAEQFTGVSKKSWKMTAVSLLSIIVHFSPIYADADKENCSTPHGFPPEVVKHCLKAYSQAWEIIDFVEETDTEPDGVTSEAADKYFQAMQKKLEKAGFPANNFRHATPECVRAALEELKKESKSKIEPVQGRRNGWEGNDSIDWKAAASGLAVYNLCNSIECNDGTNASELLKELESSLADIINECLERVQNLLLLNSRKWALRRDERRLGKALYTAGKARAIMEKLVWNELAVVSHR